MKEEKFDRKRVDWLHSSVSKEFIRPLTYKQNAFGLECQLRASQAAEDEVQEKHDER